MALQYPHTANPPAFSAIVNVNLPEITNGTAAAQTLTTTLKGAMPEYFYHVSCKNLDAGLIIGQAYSDAIGTVKVVIANVTGAPINPTAKDFTIVAY